MELSGRNLCCDRGGRRVFADLNFSVETGGMLILRGPNGIGKTSLLRMIAELNEPAQGTLSLSGIGDDLAIAQYCHFVAHQDAFKPALTVRENLKFWADYLGGGDVDKGLAAFSLEPLAQFSAGLLSAGQKRRLALARLKMVDRPVWLLDEPTVGLDAASVGQLQNVMNEHLDGGGIIVATTHIDLGMKAAKMFDFGLAGVGA